jgi:hypothetical protein
MSELLTPFNCLTSLKGSKGSNNLTRTPAAPLPNSINREGANGHQRTAQKQQVPPPNLNGQNRENAPSLTCDECGKPGAKPWPIHGRVVCLHDRCQDAWHERECQELATWYAELTCSADRQTRLLQERAEKAFPPELVNGAIERVAEIVAKL